MDGHLGRHKAARSYEAPCHIGPNAGQGGKEAAWLLAGGLGTDLC